MIFWGKYLGTFMIGLFLGCSYLLMAICLHSSVIMSLCQNVILRASIVNVAMVMTSYFLVFERYSLEVV